MNLDQIRKAVAAEIQKLQKVYAALRDTAEKRRKLSKAARAKISAAQKARWKKPRKAA